MEVCVVTKAESARGDHCTMASSALKSDLDVNAGPEGTFFATSCLSSSSVDPAPSVVVVVVTVDDSRPIRSG